MDTAVLQRKQILRQLFDAGVRAVDGFSATSRALKNLPTGKKVYLVAVGKAAASMAEGALSVLGDKLVAGLVISKHGHMTDVVKADSRLQCLESSHPVPDQSSLQAGATLVAMLGQIPEDAHLVFLVSGGTSSLVEHLPPERTLADLESMNRELLASGLAIGEMNQRRRSASLIKGGRLADYLSNGIRVTQLLISDVPGDKLLDIGSGLLIADQAVAAPAARVLRLEAVDTHIVASNTIAQAAVVKAAETMGLIVRQKSGSLHGDVETVQEQIAAVLTQPDLPPGLYIWGGEPTVVLPESPGRGGRNQHLALLLAGAIEGIEHLSVLVCGTDGSDGPTSDAGGLVDGKSMAAGRQSGLDGEAALRAADAGSWLHQCQALVTTGPTGTNVMDLAIALKTAG